MSGDHCGHLSKDDVSIANRPRPVVQVQNAVSTKESRPVSDKLNSFSFLIVDISNWTFQFLLFRLIFLVNILVARPSASRVLSY